MKKWLTAGAKSGNLGESSTALEMVTRERIQSVSQQFFTEIWGLGESRRGRETRRPRGARRQWRGKREMCWREERERMTMNIKRSPPPPPPKTMTTVTRIS